MTDLQIKNNESSLVTTQEVQCRMLPLRNQNVIIDRDVAALYGVETKRINEAVRNNPEKFPDGYIFELTNSEVKDVKNLINERINLADEKFDHKTVSPKTRYAPKAFTERGLYMLATILKSARATQTTIAIIDTFAKVKELSRHVNSIQNTNSLDNDIHVQKTGQLLSELLTQELTGSDNFGIGLNVMSISITQTKKNNNG